MTLTTTTNRAEASIWYDGIQARDEALAWMKERNLRGDLSNRIAARLVRQVVGNAGYIVAIGPKRVPCTAWTEYLAEAKK
jgi:hypothetical protein